MTTRKRTSPIWTIEKHKLQILLNKSNTIIEILKIFNLNPYSGNHRTLHARIKKDNLSLDKLNQNRKNFLSKNSKKKAKPLSSILTKNSNYSRDHLKIRLIDNNLLINKCAICYNKGNWKDKPLSLQLDHINGVSNDNRLENLRLLCPNCHSQTETFSGRKNRRFKKHEKKQIDCPTCNNKMYYKSNRCNHCRAINNRKFEVSKEKLTKLIKLDKIPFTIIGKMFNVSDNAIRKRARKFGII